MVEGQSRAGAEGNPCSGGGIVASARWAPPAFDLEHDRHDVLPGVPAGVGVDPQDPTHSPGETRLLLELAAHGVLDRLAELDEAPRERPLALEWRVPAADEENAGAPDPESINRQGRPGVASRHTRTSRWSGIRASVRASGGLRPNY